MAIDTVNGSARASTESFEVTNPADGSVFASVPLDAPADVAETVARVRANQPAWEALGIKGRAEWLYKLRDWILDHRPHQLLREEGPQVHRRREGPGALNFDEGQEAQGPVPAISRRRRDQSLELPADPLPRRRDPGAGRGRGCRHQALG